MMQEMDLMEASCVLYMKVDRFVQFKQHKMSILTVSSLEIVMLSVHYELIVSL
jgi:hypothetical protein